MNNKLNAGLAMLLVLSLGCYAEVDGGLDTGSDAVEEGKGDIEASGASGEICGFFRSSAIHDNYCRQIDQRGGDWQATCEADAYCHVESRNSPYGFGTWCAKTWDSHCEGGDCGEDLIVLNAQCFAEDGGPVLDATFRTVVQEPIPQDGGLLISEMVVPHQGTIVDLSVKADLFTERRSIEVVLERDGEEIVLEDRDSTGFDLFGEWHVPEFNGTDMEGPWRLKVRHKEAAETARNARLSAWRLQFHVNEVPVESR